MNNAMPALSSEDTLLIVDVTMHNHDSHASAIITRDGLVVSTHTIAQAAPMFELVLLVNRHRRVNERVKYRIHRKLNNI